MTKKDYMFLATVIKKLKKELDNKDTILQDPVLFLIDELAYYLEIDNPRFNEQKFRESIYN